MIGWYEVAIIAGTVAFVGGLFWYNEVFRKRNR